MSYTKKWEIWGLRGLWTWYVTDFIGLGCKVILNILKCVRALRVLMTYFSYWLWSLCCPCTSWFDCCFWYSGPWNPDCSFGAVSGHQWHSSLMLQVLPVTSHITTLCVSSTAPLSYGVPQGSVLGPLSSPPWFDSQETAFIFIAMRMTPRFMPLLKGKTPTVLSHC